MTGPATTFANDADCPELSGAGRADGTTLSRKGRETRQRLMDAGVRLLTETSPVDLTAAAIAKEAGLASATFYFYFRDIRNMLWAISDTITTEMIAAYEALGVFRERGDVDRDSRVFVAMLGAWWERHHVILHYRNMEADRGEASFRAQRHRWAMTVLEPLSRLFGTAPHIRPPLDSEDALAEALVIFTSMERLAAAVQREAALTVTPEKMRAAQARILTRILISEND